MTAAEPRRGFLRGLVGSSAGCGVAASGIPTASAQGRGVVEPTGTLVIVNLVGGLDGLSVLVPHGDAGYTARRPGLAVGPPGERYGAIDLGRGLGLHPALGPLQDTLGRSDRLAIIGGVGVPDSHGGDRNHLPSREFVQRGGRDETDGWAARLLRFEGMGPEAVWTFGPGPHPMFDGLPETVTGPPSVVAIGAHADRSGPFVATSRGRTGLSGARAATA